MTMAGLILRNAARNRRRLFLTVSSVAVGLFLLTILQVLLHGLTDPEPSDVAANRLVIRHRVSLANMLFARYKRTIEELPGVAACTKLIWFGGIYQDEKNFFPQFACDPADLFEVMAEAQIDPQQLQSFIREKNACVVGTKTMARFGWKVGDRITLLGAMWPCNPELVIRGVFSGFDETILYFQHDYFDELLEDQGITGLFWVRCNRPEDVPRLREVVDATFRNSEAETTTETEHAFQLGFVSLLGNVKLLIGALCTVIVFTLLLVTLSAIAMAVRERTTELAILKTLGFDRVRLFGLILAESVGLALVGGVIGCLGALGLVRVVDMYKLSRGLFVSFEVTPDILSLSLLGAGLLGLVSCLIPAYTALRSSIAASVRPLE